MKALTLTQPYATLVVEGWKKWETRSWPTRYRGPLAIHASAGFGGVGGRFEFEKILLGLHPGISGRLLFNYGRGPANILDIPLGAVLGVTWIEDVYRTEDVRAEIRETDEISDGWELTVGDYSDGRYAWRFREPVVITPIPWRGRQGLWNLPDGVVPENVLRAVAHPV